MNMSARLQHQMRTASSGPVPASCAPSLHAWPGRCLQAHKEERHTGKKQYRQEGQKARTSDVEQRDVNVEVDGAVGLAVCKEEGELPAHIILQAAHVELVGGWVGG